MSANDHGPSGKARPLRLIFHVGAGKTGTSSIQQTLGSQQEVLKDLGYWYLGLMLEHANVRQFPWQDTLASEVFHAMAPDEASEQLTAVLKAVVADARRTGLHTLIWSNESFIRRNTTTHPALAALQRDGVEISLVAYVRRHDAWARSAYVQWGIKHKTYGGPIQPFNAWIKNRNPAFHADLLRLRRAFPGSLVVRNLDAVGDAVADFLKVIGLSSPRLAQLRTNETPTGVELVLRALFNNGVPGEALPSRFERCVGRSLDFATPVADYFDRLMPTDADLERVKDHCANDREALDSLLAEHGQPPIDTSRLSIKPTTLDTQALIRTLSEIVVQQSLRLERLEKRVRALSESLGAPTQHEGDQ